MVTEVNGHDCRKGVGISRIMELKTLIQQTSIEQEETTVSASLCYVQYVVYYVQLKIKYLNWCIVIL